MAGQKSLKQRCLRWVKRGVLSGIVGLVALALVGAIWQAFATAADRRNFPPPGWLVDVGGHRLHIQCAGVGRLTVVLETGALSMSALWGWVRPLAARHTRVCSYDRAGLGWSEPGSEPRDAIHISRELHTLLNNAGETPPYVLVGHSYGGLLVRMYADQHPEDVAGLLLLDSSHPDQVVRIEKVLGKPAFLENLQESMFASLSILARLGILRFMLRHTGSAGRFDDLPPRAAAEFKAFFADASHQSAAEAEMRVWKETAGQVRATRPLGDLPLVVISAEGTKPPSREQQVRHELHRELAALSSRGSHRILAGTTHASLVENRGHAAQVAEAIRELVDAASTQGKKK